LEFCLGLHPLRRMFTDVRYPHLETFLLWGVVGVELSGVSKLAALCFSSIKHGRTDGAVECYLFFLSFRLSFNSENLDGISIGPGRGC